MAEFRFQHVEQGPNQGPAARVIIVLHGMGSSGSKAIEQVSWIAPAFPRAQIYAPNGPDEHIPAMDQWTPKAPT